MQGRLYLPLNLPLHNNNTYAPLFPKKVKSIDLLEALMAAGEQFSLEFVEWVSSYTSRRMYTMMLKLLRERRQ